MKTRGILGVGLLLLSAVFPKTLLAMGAAEHPDAWIEVRSPHFTVKSNAAEKLARGIARQFEEIRAAFQEAFPELRVDPGKPMIVLAVKDEESMKTLLPEFWKVEGGVHPSGLYVTSFDENFAILRVDVTATEENPYQALYHEYAHAILRLNYRELPAWLSEGMSDFLGNTIVSGGDVELGHVNATELKLLQRSTLIPIDALMKVDKASNLYNEKDRASIFYAEAWALVHYLSLDPEGSKNEPLIRYLKAYEESDDASAAAREAFGDLGELERKLQHYAGQKTFRSQKLKSALAIFDADFSLRGISRGEALVAEADFLQHNLHEKEAQLLAAEAIALEPKLATLHAYLGYVKYIHFYDEEAEKEFTEAEKLDAKDFRPVFYLAELNYRKKGFTSQMTPRIVASLERTLQLNDSFAPAFAFLSIAYLQEPETRPKALDAALKASALEPTSMAYAVNAANALMLMNRDEEAQVLRDKLKKSAKTQMEKSIVAEFDERYTKHEAFLAKKRAENPGVLTADLFDEEGIPDTPLLQPATGSDSAEDWHRVATQWTETVEGEFREADCSQAPRANVRFVTAGEILHLTVRDTHEVEYRPSGVEATTATNACSKWKGRKAKIKYRAASVEGEAAEIFSIEFE